ncbi:MAG: PEP-CTERM sorting domain-containing protein [Phycisphaeraceae bacterium]|nr:PEP-CTERM sorting domain-containing protein [Phycisphaeraceae bacterium]
MNERDVVLRPGTTRSRSWGAACIRAAAVLAIAALAAGPARASIVGISGTMSNFDVFNETGVNVYGAELEIEGVHASEVEKTYPSHFDSVIATEYTNGSTYGTRFTFTGYNFDPPNTFITPTVGQNTNGHFAVDLKGCEHFGFSVWVQPTATRFFWLDEASQRIGTSPLGVPNPSWTYIPPAVPGNPPVIRAIVEVPEPEDPEPQLPDSIWMKVYVTEIEREVELEELMSGNDIVPQDNIEIETEWELLEGGVQEPADFEVGDNVVSIIHRYEFFKYIGPTKAEDNAPLSSWDGIGDPPAEEMGEFIAANMVAVNFEIPEPSSAAVLLVSLGAMSLAARRRSNH